MSNYQMPVFSLNISRSHSSKTLLDGKLEMTGNIKHIKHNIKHKAKLRKTGKKLKMISTTDSS